MAGKKSRAAGGESARFPPVWPGSISQPQRHTWDMWAEFVVGSRPQLARGLFSGFSLQNPTLPIFISIRNFDGHRFVSRLVVKFDSHETTKYIYFLLNL